MLPTIKMKEEIICEIKRKDGIIYGISMYYKRFIYIYN